VRLPKDQPRPLECRWGGKCPDCGLKIAAGEMCLWTPSTKRMVHAEGRCGKCYVVQCVYRVTSKRLRFVAFNPEHAVELARKECGKGKPLALPESYIVWHEGAAVHVEEGDAISG
jgi:nucleoside diphosphate kinase